MTSEDRAAQHVDADSRGARSSLFSRPLPVWQESILLLGVALVLAVILKAFFVQAFYIPSESMEPGLIRNDRILVQKVSYWGDGGPERGDVVVFEDPGGWLEGDTTGPTSFLARGLAKVGLYPSGGHLVKRVIAVAGDVVTTDGKGHVVVNGHTLDEDDYLMEKDAECDVPNLNCRKKVVGPIPDGYLFVMGDNRSNSSDSTAKFCQAQETECPPTRGLVPVDNVVGKVFSLVWPAGRMDWISRPDTFEDIPDSP